MIALSNCDVRVKRRLNGSDVNLPVWWQHQAGYDRTTLNNEVEGKQLFKF